MQIITDPKVKKVKVQNPMSDQIFVCWWRLERRTRRGRGIQSSGCAARCRRGGPWPRLRPRGHPRLPQGGGAVWRADARGGQAEAQDPARQDGSESGRVHRQVYNRGWFWFDDSNMSLISEGIGVQYYISALGPCYLPFLYIFFNLTIVSLLDLPKHCPVLPLILYFLS